MGGSSHDEALAWEEKEVSTLAGRARQPREVSTRARGSVKVNVFVSNILTNILPTPCCSFWQKRTLVDNRCWLTIGHSSEMR